MQCGRGHFGDMLYGDQQQQQKCFLLVAWSTPLHEIMFNKRLSVISNCVANGLSTKGLFGLELFIKP